MEHSAHDQGLGGSLHLVPSFSASYAEITTHTITSVVEVSGREDKDSLDSMGTKAKSKVGTEVGEGVKKNPTQIWPL